MKTACNVARDLMPLCIDGAASKESMTYLSEHLSECEACRASYEDMKTALPGQRAEKTAEEQARFDQMARMMKQMHRWRVWRNVVIGILAGALAVVGAYAGWQGLAVQYHAEFPTGEYRVSLAQLKDGRVAVSVDYLHSKRNIGLVLGESKRILSVWYETTHLPQNMASENKNGPVKVINDMSRLDAIAVGHRREQLVWRRGDPIAEASEEMEAYFRADAALAQAWQEIHEREARGETPGEGPDDLIVRALSLQTKREELRLQVPEWQ